jgi:glycosyltransferase involved in cell wall biosynthesis
MEFEPLTLSYCVFDRLQWESTRGLGRFAAQLTRHLERMNWRGINYPRPRWKSPMGRVFLSQIVEPLWLERLRPDIAFYPHNTLPALFASHRSLRILVLHDVLFLDSSNRNAGNRYRAAQVRRSLGNADLILTVSEASRAEILRLLPTGKQILVLPNALSTVFERADFPRTRIPGGTARILHFGGHAPSKNTRTVLEAVSTLRRDGCDVHLALASMSDNAALVERWRREVGLSPEALTVLPRLSDEDLRRVYAESALHCMPSIGEGFGIPVVEAARCGTVNVLTPLPVFRGLVGDAAIFADSFGTASVVRALKEGLAVEAGPIAERAIARSARFRCESVHRLEALPVFREIEAMARSRNEATGKSPGKRD